MKHTILILATILILSACNSQQPATQVDSRIAQRIVETPIDRGMSVKEARESAVPGGELVVTGRIAGAREPFSKDYATLILADDSLKTCDRIPGDSCATPWDACCEESETIQALRLLVQITGADGLPIDASIKGVGGLKEMDEITVVGSVDAASTPGNLILNAKKIHRAPVAR